MRGPAARLQDSITDVFISNDGRGQASVRNGFGPEQVQAFGLLATQHVFKHASEPCLSDLLVANGVPCHDALPRAERARALRLHHALRRAPTVRSINGGFSSAVRVAQEILRTCACRCGNLTSLDLRSNSLGDGGANALAAALVRLPSLAVLHLADNRIDDEGAMSIAGALPQ